MPSCSQSLGPATPPNTHGSLRHPQTPLQISMALHVLSVQKSLDQAHLMNSSLKTKSMCHLHQVPSLTYTPSLSLAHIYRAPVSLCANWRKWPPRLADIGSPFLAAGYGLSFSLSSSLCQVPFCRACTEQQRYSVAWFWGPSSVPSYGHSDHTTQKIAFICSFVSLFLHYYHPWKSLEGKRESPTYPGPESWALSMYH